MAGDVISDWAWIFWLLLVLIFLIIEVNTLQLTFLMLAIGAIGALVAELLGAVWWVQIITAAVLSLLLLFVARPPLLRILKRGGDPTRSNVDALRGLEGSVTLAFQDGRGQVRLANGETWTARVAAGSEAQGLDEGDRVLVTQIEGATAVVIPSPRTEGSLS